MKTNWLVIFFTVAVGAAANAQSYDKKVLKAGDDLSAISYYLFPSFTDATVTLPQGKLVSKMNFNLLTCQLQFIDGKGDTLNLARPKEVERAAFDSVYFFYADDGYYEAGNTAAAVQLLVYRKASFNPVKVGAFGVQQHNGAGIEAFEALVTRTGDRRLLVNEDIEILHTTIYYLQGPGGERIKAGKAAFVKLFPGKKEVIETTIKANKINFNKEADLRLLLKVCE